ncbi:MAG: hypothetical protein AAF384_17845 [Pseudomonadota bacterium]
MLDIPLCKPRILLLLLVLAESASAAPDDLPDFKFSAPQFFSVPVAARSFLGTTYAYTSARETRLFLSVIPIVDVEREFGRISELDCVSLFLNEVASSHKGFFSNLQRRPLPVGDAKFVQFRWSGESGGIEKTGVLSCGVSGGWYLVVHFLDEIKSATNTFPLIRSALRTLSLP